MKHFTIRVIGIFLALFSISALAAPYLYTFTGTINYIEVNGESYSDYDFDGDYTTTGDTFRVGDVMEYTFLVDFDLPGFCSGPLGTTYSDLCTGANIPDSQTANYFFSDLVSATKLAPPTEENTFFNYGLSISNLGWLVSDSAVFIISPYHVPVEQWVAASDTVTGTMVTGNDVWDAPNGNTPNGRINSLLTLTSIVPVVVDKPDNKNCKHNDKTQNHSMHDDKESYHKHSKYKKFKVLESRKKGMHIYMDKSTGYVRIKLDHTAMELNKNSGHTDAHDKP